MRISGTIKCNVWRQSEFLLFYNKTITTLASDSSCQPHPPDKIHSYAHYYNVLKKSSDIFPTILKTSIFLQLLASDADQGVNSRLLYHIVDGNIDNAFKIDPPNSGIVRTNIVLDREIRDHYKLTIIATDQGNPQLTGTTVLSVRVTDINDNQPTFPEPMVVSISEGTFMTQVLYFVFCLHNLIGQPLLKRQASINYVIKKSKRRIDDR